MPSTPARRMRDAEEADAKREAGRKQNEDKYTEFKMGCDAGQVSACNSLGEWWALMRQDFHSAASLYTPACIEHKYPQACLNLGMILAGGSGGVTPSAPQAIKVFGIGCERGNADSCSEAARLLLREAVSSSSSPSSSSVPSHPSHPSNDVSSATASSAAIQSAERYLSLGCNGGDSVPHAKCCGMLGSIYTSKRFSELAASGGVTPPASATVLQCLERGCRGEQPSACMRLATIYKSHAGSAQFGVQHDVQKGLALEKQALVWAGMSELQAEATVQRRAATAARGGKG